MKLTSLTAVVAGYRFVTLRSSSIQPPWPARQFTPPANENDNSREQAHSGVSSETHQPDEIGVADYACGRSRPVIATARVVVGSASRRLLDKTLRHQLLQIIVKRSGTQFILTLGLAGDFLHDAVAVAILGGERKQNVESRRRKRQVRA